MNVLIIGGSRFIGKAVADLAANKGHDVTLFNRGMTDASSCFKCIHGDVDKLKDHKSAFRDLKPDIVIHAIAYTQQHALDAIDVFSGSDAKLIVLSSQDCYEAFYQLNRGRDVAELPIAEDGQTCLKKYYWQDLPGMKTYSNYDKNLVTEAFMSACAEGLLSATVLRLPMVFGPGDFQFRHRHGKIIRRILDQQKTLLMGAVEQTSLFTFGYIDNIAAAILHAAEAHAVTGKVFNIGESKARSLRRWAELYAEAAGTQFDLQILPDALIEHDAAAINNPPRLILFDTQAFRSETEFVEPVSLREQVQQTLSWGLEHPDALGARPDYQAEQRLVETYSGFMHNCLKIDRSVGDSKI